MYNTSKNEHLLSTRMGILLGKISDLTDNQVKEEFKSIVNDPVADIDSNTRAKWWNSVNDTKGRIELMVTLCNLHLI